MMRIAVKFIQNKVSYLLQAGVEVDEDSEAKIRRLFKANWKRAHTEKGVALVHEPHTCVLRRD